MGQSRTMTITVPETLAQFVEAQVASGAYATESDVIRDGLESLVDKDIGAAEPGADFDHWLKMVAVPALAAVKADPSQRRSIAQVKASLARAHAQATQRAT